MTLQSRLAALVGAIGADIKTLDGRLDVLEELGIPSLSASTYTSVTGAGGANVPMTAAAITLTPGTWLVRASANCATNTADGVSCGIYDMTAGAAVAGSAGPAGTCPTAGYSTHVSTTRVITTSVNKQICPLGYRHGGSALTVTTGIASGPAADIQAIRLTNGLVGAPSAPQIAMESWKGVGAIDSGTSLGAGVSHGTPNLQFRKYPDGRVRIRGLVNTTGSTNYTLFTLPAGYRPPGTVRFPVQNAGGVGIASVDSAGAVVAYSPGAWVHVEVEFDTDGTYWPVGQVQPIPLVTALPTPEYHGQEIYLQTSTMASSGHMPIHLRYNAYSSSAHKWEVLGSAPMFADTNISGNSTPTINAWTDVPSGPTIALPAAGAYDILFGASLYHPSASQGMYIAPVATGLAGNLNNGAYFGQSGSGGAAAAVSRSLAAGGISGTLKLQYYQGVTGSVVDRPWIRAIPLRLG